MRAWLLRVTERRLRAVAQWVPGKGWNKVKEGGQGQRRQALEGQVKEFGLPLSSVSGEPFSPCPAPCLA